MNILGIDTSSEWLNVCVGRDGSYILGKSYWVPRKHVAILHDVIGEVLKETGIDIKEIELVGVVIGPGSFTGIRIGVSCVKGLLYPLRKECVSLISLDLLAENVERDDAFVMPLIDAKRGQVYTALYQRKEGKVSRLSDHMLLRIEEALNKIKYPAILLGDGIKVYEEKVKEFTKGKDVELLGEGYWNIKGQRIIECAYRKYKTEGGEDIFQLKPFYIYPKECTIVSKPKCK